MRVGLRRPPRCRLGPVLTVVLALVLVIGMSACTRSDAADNSAVSDSTSTASASSSAPSIGPESPGATGVAPPAALDALVVTAADLPTGWAQSSATKTPSSSPTPGEGLSLSACTGTSSTAVAPAEVVRSATFSRDSSSVSSTAERYASAASVQTNIAALSSPLAQSCLEMLIVESSVGQLPMGGTLTDAHVTVEPGQGSNPAGVTATADAQFALNIAGQTSKAFVDVVWLARDDVDASVQFFGIGSPIDPSIRSAVVKRVAERLAR